jgi:hypothetical protein
VPTGRSPLVLAVDAYTGQKPGFSAHAYARNRCASSHKHRWSECVRSNRLLPWAASYRPASCGFHCRGALHNLVATSRIDSARLLPSRFAGSGLARLVGYRWLRCWRLKPKTVPPKDASLATCGLNSPYGDSIARDACRCGGAGMPCPKCNPSSQDEPPRLPGGLSPTPSDKADTASMCERHEHDQNYDYGARHDGDCCEDTVSHVPA